MAAERNPDEAIGAERSDIGAWPVIGRVVAPSSTLEFRVAATAGACQIGDIVAAEVSGRALEEKTSTSTVWGRVSKLEVDPELSFYIATVTPLGRIQSGKQSALYPLTQPLAPGTRVRMPVAAAIQQLLGTVSKDDFSLRLGTLLSRSDVAVSVSATSLVSRHLAVVAMTGAGKTVAVRRLIRDLSGLRYPIVVLDPHGDYLALARARKALGETVVKVFHPHLTVSPEDTSLFEDLIFKMSPTFTSAQSELLGWLLKTPPKKRHTPITYLKTLLEALQTAESGGVPDMPRISWNTFPVVRRALESVHSRLEAMEAASERLRKEHTGIRILPLPDVRAEPEQIVAPGQISILCLSGYESLVQSAVSAILLEGLFSHRLAVRKRIPPVLLVVEEAQNFIPADSGGDDNPCLPALRKILTEGRKFGVGAVLVTQRPSLVDATALSQCNTFLAMRIVNSSDQEYVARVIENVSSWELAALPTLGPGQGIVAGQAVKSPVLVQVDFDSDLVNLTSGVQSSILEASEWRTTNAEVEGAGK